MERQLVVFSINQEDYGVPIEQVREIIRLEQVTAVPKMPDGILGVINLRGKVIPVASLRMRFGLGIGENSDSTRIVVGEVQGRTIGFVVDSVTEVLRIDEEHIEAAPADGSIDSRFIKGIGKANGRLIIILDLEQVVQFGLGAMAV